MSENEFRTIENDEYLIHFVKNHEALHDIKIKEYKHAQLKQHLWKNIGAMLQKQGV